MRNVPPTDAAPAGLPLGSNGKTMEQKSCAEAETFYEIVTMFANLSKNCHFIYKGQGIPLNFMHSFLSKIN